MSPTWAPARTAAMPASSASWVVRSSAAASGRMAPTGTVSALSAWKPPTQAPTSTLTMSPSWSTRLREGMPWTTSSLIEVHRVAG